MFRRQALLSAQRITELEEENTRLRDGLEEARRAGKRQAAPFSRGEKKPDPATPGQTRPGVREEGQAAAA
ncbi:MAG: hypothetical protein ACRD0K_04620 [Egibacteraceae bacterium]